MKEVKRISFQGDMLMLRVDNIPDDAIPELKQYALKEVPPTFEKARDNIVAHSETGHHHVAVGELTRYESKSDPMASYLVCKGDVIIEHKRPNDTHEAWKLLGNDGGAGGEVIWRIGRQREYTPQGLRRVED